MNDIKLIESAGPRASHIRMLYHAFLHVGMNVDITIIIYILSMLLWHLLS